ncbi:MAG: hypothetical protein H6853_02865 [Rhodospirillales bacterium]|nr:hypothetical protein [Alphaproteobacteria bacterium]USO04582.1 MAG: hypothetical protein H6853_02865 [Rhodospirillales bacterium]
MVYIYGVIGFVGGFAWGLFMIHLFLRGRSARELLENKSLRWPYGLFVWMVAAGGLYAGLWMYETHPISLTN